MQKITLALASLLVAGCAAPAYISPVEVTRFVAPAATLGQGTITLAPAPGTDSTQPEYSSFADAIAQQLAALGYSVVAQGGAQVAQVALVQSVRTPERRGPVSVGGGASTGSYGSGVGVGIGLDLTPRPADSIETRLSLNIRNADGGTNLWEGRASMSATANAEFGTTQTAATRMAEALLRGFPGASGETILVE